MAAALADKLRAALGAPHVLTGIELASLTGGAGDNPIGTIYVGLHAPGGDWSKKLTYPGPRCAVKERAVTAAIDWLRREAVKESLRVAAPLAN